MVGEWDGPFKCVHRCLSIADVFAKFWDSSNDNACTIPRCIPFKCMGLCKSFVWGSLLGQHICTPAEPNPKLQTKIQIIWVTNNPIPQDPRIPPKSETPTVNRSNTGFLFSLNFTYHLEILECHEIQRISRILYGILYGIIRIWQSQHLMSHNACKAKRMRLTHRAIQLE